MTRFARPGWWLLVPFQLHEPRDRPVPIRKGRRALARVLLAEIVGTALVGCVISITAFSSRVAAEERTIQGEVVDPAAFLKEGRHGAEAENQTYEAVDGGQTLALLEAGTETLYLFLAEEAGEDPNELVYDHVNKQVTVTGSVYERGGMRGIVATAIQPVEPATAPAASTPTPADGSAPPPTGKN